MEYIFTLSVFSTLIRDFLDRSRPRAAHCTIGDQKHGIKETPGPPVLLLKLTAAALRVAHSALTENTQPRCLALNGFHLEV